MAKLAREKSLSSSDHELQLVNLFDVDIDILEVEDPRESIPTFDIFTTPPESFDGQQGQFSFRVHISVGRKKKDAESNFIQVSGIYGCVISCKEKKIAEAVARKYAQTTVWGIFTSLFAVITQQMQFEFPPLPVSPGLVDVREVLYTEDVEADE